MPLRKIKFLEKTAHWGYKNASLPLYLLFEFLFFCCVLSYWVSVYRPINRVNQRYLPNISHSMIKPTALWLRTLSVVYLRLTKKISFYWTLRPKKKKSCLFCRNFISIYKINRILHCRLGICFAHLWKILSALEHKIRIPRAAM